MGSLHSSEAEHWSRKPGVVSSILTGGRNFYLIFSRFLVGNSFINSEDAFANEKPLFPLLLLRSWYR